MSLITTHDLTKSYGAEEIFSAVSISIPKRARIGLVGANGVGKTTLLRVLIGLEEPSEGSVSRSKGMRAAYLPQEAAFEAQGTLMEVCQGVFLDLVVQRKELERLEKMMANPDKARETLEVYGKRQQVYESLGGYTYETRILQTLSGLGFSEGDLNRPLRQLSGGQRTRALLARLLLEDPELLLLDEPTNHLDIAAIEWLEAYLREWSGAVVCVSHDRYFLDQVTDTIWEMTPAIELYRGNYSAYLIQRPERYQRKLDEYQDQQALIKKEEDFIRRNIAGQNTRQAQGRRKRLERLLQEAKLNPPQHQRRMKLQIQASERSGDLVLRTYHLSIGYQDEGRPLFCVPDLVLRRGECVAILGPNGAGKTTFLKTLLNETLPLQGEVALGASLKIGYLDQAHEKLDPARTLIEEIFSVRTDLLPAEVRDYLARFLFTNEDVFKRVAVLSGGERSRLALACLALSEANLLLLDEPTNHLDLPSQEALQKVLSDYNGTILLVTHDRYLVDALASQIWEVLPDQGKLRVYNGNYSECMAAMRAADLPGRDGDSNKKKRIKPQRQAVVDKRSSYSEHQRQRKINALEQEIEILERELALVSRRLEKPPLEVPEVQRLGMEYQKIQQKLERHMEEWAQLASPTVPER